jgi:outer membrane scaffolding protein for murein synthesis (MipA/OmpV family)
MKTSTFMKIIALLAIGATLPLGAFAADPTKTVTSQGVTQTKTQKVKAEKVKAPPRKHYIAQPWMGDPNG